MAAVREQHDNHFRKILRLSFMKCLDINYDLGIIFNDKGQIINDTQMVTGLSFNQYEKSNEDLVQFGKKTGEAISFIYRELETYFGKEKIRLKQMVSNCQYLDIKSSVGKSVM